MSLASDLKETMQQVQNKLFEEEYREEFDKIIEQCKTHALLGEGFCCIPNPPHVLITERLAKVGFRTFNSGDQLNIYWN